jgi:hypothetical protein
MQHRSSTLTGACAQSVMHAGDPMTATVAAPGSILAASGDPGTTSSAPRRAVIADSAPSHRRPPDRRQHDQPGPGRPHREPAHRMPSLIGCGRIVNGLGLAAHTANRPPVPSLIGCG